MNITWVKEMIVKFQIDYIIFDIFKHRQLTVVLNQQQMFVQHNFMNIISIPGQMRKHTEKSTYISCQIELRSNWIHATKSSRNKFYLCFTFLLDL